MRNFFYALFLLISCTDPKEQIVDREIIIKETLERMNEISMNLNFLKVKDSAIKNKDSILTDARGYHYKYQDVLDSISSLEKNKSSLLSEYDSLEMELKKY